MRLGVGYLIFSGAEFLKPAIQQIRPHVDYIVGLYCLKSNDGVEAPDYLMPLLWQLEREGLIDELVEYVPPTTKDPVNLQACERVRYEIGRGVCKAKGCTHYLACDCDELYEGGKFKKVLDNFPPVDFTIARIRDYVGTPNNRAKSYSRLHVPFIHKIDCAYQAKHYPVLMDLGRTVLAQNHQVISPDSLVMHHMTAVRYNEVELLRKFQGHSHFTRLGEKKIKEYMGFVKNAQHDPNYELVVDKFGIQAYWASEFKPLYDRCMV